MDSTSNQLQKQQQLLPEEESVDIKKYLFLILSHWWWFAISVFLGLTIAYMVNRYTQQIFNVRCSVIIGEEQAGSGSIESVMDELSRVRNRRRKAVVENEISILKSYKMARMALEELEFGISYVAVGRRGIAEMQLYKQSPFVVEQDTSETNLTNYPIYVTILSDSEYRLTISDPYEINKVMQFGQKFEHESFNFSIRLRESAFFDHKALMPRKYYFLIHNINSLTKQHQLGLNVEVNNDKGAILTLGMQGFVPAQLSDYLNKLSEIYLRSNLDEKNETSENTIRFIDEQLSGIVDSLEGTGLRLQQFRSANKVIDLSKEGSFLFQQVQELQSEKAIFDIQTNYFAYLLDYMNRKNEVGDVVAPSVVGIQDNLLNMLVSGLNELLIERRNLIPSINENSPQIVSIDSQIRNSKNSIKENLESLIESNQLSLSGINNRIAKIDLEVQKLPGTEKQMIDIQRKFKINDQIYTFLLQKRAEAGITKASNTSDHKILDIARSENASLVKPKTSTNYLVGFVAGAAIPLILLLLMEFFNTKITDRKYLEVNLSVPIVGNIGHNELKSEIPVYTNPKSSMAESFRAIRSNLQYILKEPHAKVIAVSSAVSGEGKTFCSVNLASIFALAGKKTLIVSLDLRRPKVHRIFKINNEEGISTFLIGKSQYNNIIKDTNVSNLYMATAGPIPPNPSELMGTLEMQQFIQNVRKEFDYVVIDTPPIGIVTDALALKNYIDAFVFVIRHSYSDKQVVDLINGLHQRHMFSNMCTVVNDIQLKGYYGYSYKYGYQYGYGYGSHYSQYEDYVEKPHRRNILKQMYRVFRIRE